MTVGTRLPVSLAKKIAKLHKRHNTSNRGWAINNGFANSTPFEFDYAAYDKDSYDDTWRMNVERVCNMDKVSVVGDKLGPRCSNWE